MTLPMLFRHTTRMKWRLEILRKQEQVSMSEQSVVWAFSGSEYAVHSNILSRTSTGQLWIVMGFREGFRARWVQQYQVESDQKCLSIAGSDIELWRSLEPLS